MWILVTAAVLLIVLAMKGRLGPLIWEGRPVAAGDTHRGLGRGPCGRWAGARPDVGADAGADSPPRESAESVLARRLADGEITPEDYLERSSLLNER
ncbi:hypothetical protein [Aestuariimicrobium ganziense]|uniref:hypothetical protein n=1 Tax=Aestuariimicrobium ganziense TaxID=2773677 RepID=UPI001943A4B0|nr:hypothetical protein [Aestuariimicrobium ganziense]